MGGTEVYVAALAAELCSHGIESTIAAPGEQAGTYERDGVYIDRYSVDPVVDVAGLYGEGDPAAARAFGDILDRRRPDVVHLHARTRAVSLRTLREAKRRGLPVVYTYHTPTGSCPRGTLMRWGSVPCDGRLTVGRCTACVLNSGGIPRPVALALAAMPGLNRIPATGRLATALGTRRHIETAHRATATFLSEADHVVSVCSWVDDLLARLGVEDRRRTLSRQGLAHDAPPAEDRDERNVGPLRLAFFGRLSPEKGLSTVLDALNLLSQRDICLDVYGTASNGNRALSDSRVRWMEPVEPSAVVPTLREYDALVVPSRWLETGPLVVLEAFAAGIPVIGSRLGGISELVTEGLDGLLLPPDSPQGWADAIGRLAADPAHLSRLRAGIRPPRRMAAAAADMAAVYHSLLR